MKSTGKRLKKIIESDRLMLSADTAEMICFDLKNLLNEYFNVESGVTISVEPKSECYYLTVNAKASGIKSFKVVR